MLAKAYDTSRRVTRAVCLLSVLGAVSLQVQAAPVYFADTDHFYERVDALPGMGYTWDGARDAAESMSYLGVQGHLATVTSQAENDFLFDNLGLPETSLLRYWLGGFQPPDSVEPNGGWSWVTGEAWAYTNWSPGEPNDNGRPHEDGLVGWYNATWNDFDWNNSAGEEFWPPVWIENGFVVEYSIAGPTTLLIDIKPGSLPNSINLKSRGVLPVAVLGSEDLDVSLIDPDTVTLEGVAPRVSGNSGHFWSLEDVNGDSILDLMLHFNLQELTIDPESAELTLEGLLTDGTAFEGSDSIRIVPPMDGEVIPEPATLSLLVLGGLMMLKRRRR